MKNEPAFPSLKERIYHSGMVGKIETGMSKRFFAACMAMQGFLASPMTIKTSEELAKRSFEAADGLLKWEENDLGENE